MERNNIYLTVSVPVFAVFFVTHEMRSILLHVSMHGQEEGRILTTLIAGMLQ